MSASDEREAPTGTAADRKTRPAPPAWTGWALAVFVAFLIVAGGVGYAIKKFDAVVDDVRKLADGNQQAVKQIAQEGVERRDQICSRDEREHLTAVSGLRLTYEYLVSLTPEQRDEPINRLLIRELPRTEREARADTAPPFCDEPGEAAERAGAPPVGLPEPDPVVPPRPRSLR